MARIALTTRQPACDVLELMGLPRCYPEVVDALLELTMPDRDAEQRQAAEQARKQRLADMTRRMRGR